MVLAVGTASSTSRDSTCCLTLLCTSTTGEAPDTVTDSCSVPTLSSTLIVAVKLDCSSIAFARHGVEAGQRERQRVGAGTKIDDAVLSRSRR